MNIDRYKDLKGYGVLETFFPPVIKRVYVLNRNINTFDELLNSKVRKVRTYGCQGGASHLEVFLEDIRIINEFFK